MIDSREIKDLHPVLQEKARLLIDLCAKAGIRIIITATLRDHEYQNMLYAKGRTAPGKKVTNARGGDSMHNYGLAFDVVPLDAKGNPIWGTTGDDLKIWKEIGSIGRDVLGMVWGGDWKSPVDYPHFQYTQGLTLADLKAGKMITNDR